MNRVMRAIALSVGAALTTAALVVVHHDAGAVPDVQRVVVPVTRVAPANSIV